MTHLSNFDDWINLARQNTSMVALQAATCDRPYLLQQFLHWSKELAGLPVYFANSGYYRWQLVTLQAGATLAVSAKQCAFLEAELENTDLLDLTMKDEPGIFIIEGLFQTLSPDDFKVHVANVHFEQEHSQSRQHLILLDEDIHLPLSLYPILPVLEYPFPSKSEVQQQVAIACQSANLTILDQRQIVQACVGLPRGEIHLILKRAIAPSRQAEAIAQIVLDYKQEKLRGRGINLLPKADVPVAAGLEGLDETLDKIRFLLQPEAEQRNLRPPKAVLLWGIPGSGKSLAAKLAAQRIGATLVACDWNSLVGSTVRESMGNLNELIRYVSEIGTTILFFDEFEKAFSGWRSDTEGGVLGKLAGRLLSWMQDHTEPVIMFATINHLEMLPAEMIRRFDYIHFFGLPQAGALYQVFNVHLTKYFRYDFTELEWRILLREYRGCTPDEVGKAIQRVAHQRYFQDMAQEQMSPELPLVTVDELIAERQEFTPAAAQKDTSDQIAGILNRARYAKSAAGIDKSIFATAPQTLFGMDSKSSAELSAPAAYQFRSPPPEIEEI